MVQEIFHQTNNRNTIDDAANHYYQGNCSTATERQYRQFLQTGIINRCTMKSHTGVSTELSNISVIATPDEANRTLAQQSERSRNVGEQRARQWSLTTTPVTGPGLTCWGSVIQLIAALTSRASSDG